LIDELLQLRIIRDKVDHPRKGSKDLSDAVCGALYNSIIGTKREAKEVEIEVHTYKQLIRDKRIEQANAPNPENIIRPLVMNDPRNDWHIGMI
jgi:hypothetical protein